MTAACVEGVNCRLVYGPSQAKRCLRTYAKCTDSSSRRACAKSHPVICFPLIQFIVSNDSVSGQRRPRSACANAQADLGLRYSHVLKDTFSHVAYLDSI